MLKNILIAITCLFCVACAKQPTEKAHLSAPYELGKYRVAFVDIQPEGDLKTAVETKKGSKIAFAMLREKLMNEVMKNLAGRGTSPDIGITINISAYETWNASSGPLSDPYIKSNIILWDPSTKNVIGNIPLNYYNGSERQLAPTSIAGIIGTAIAKTIMRHHTEDKTIQGYGRALAYEVYPPYVTK